MSAPQKSDLTREELEALWDAKIGRKLSPEMMARLIKLKLGEEWRGGFGLTNDGELRLAGHSPKRAPQGRK
jgi:hypothetical protein